MTPPNDSYYSSLPPGVTSHYVMVGDARTHYLEAGAEHVDADVVVLLHSAEYGGRAMFSWARNLGELGKHFHVYAPDMLGFGGTDKVYDFAQQWDARMMHIQRFLDTLCVPKAHFGGASFSAGLLQGIAAMNPCPWNILSIISISGGGTFFYPDNPASHILRNYDGTKEWMKDLLKVLFYDERWWTDEIVEERWRASIEPGAWEAVSASRFRRPGLERGQPPAPPPVTQITVPVLLVGGQYDQLHSREVQDELHKQIPNSELKIFPSARHNPHIEHCDEFNRLAVDFLLRNSSKKRG